MHRSMSQAWENAKQMKLLISTVKTIIMEEGVGTSARETASQEEKKPPNAVLV